MRPQRPRTCLAGAARYGSSFAFGGTERTPPARPRTLTGPSLHPKSRSLAPSPSFSFSRPRRAFPLPTAFTYARVSLLSSLQTSLFTARARADERIASSSTSLARATPRPANEFPPLPFCVRARRTSSPSRPPPQPLYMANALRRISP